MSQLVEVEAEEMVLGQLLPQTSGHTAWHGGDAETFENDIGEAYLNKEYKEKR